jgi:hypothetical protein
MLKLVIALALVVGSVECAAACTPVASAQPACHHHKQAPSCTHELVPATIVQSFVVDLPSSSQALHAPTILLTLAPFDAPAFQEHSPPGPTIPQQTILRI